MGLCYSEARKCLPLSRGRQARLGQGGRLDVGGGFGFANQENAATCITSADGGGWVVGLPLRPQPTPHTHLRFQEPVDKGERAGDAGVLKLPETECAAEGAILPREGPPGQGESAHRHDALDLSHVLLQPAIEARKRRETGWGWRPRKKSDS